MSDLMSLLREVVGGVANEVTKSMQAAVAYRQCTSESTEGFTEPVYADATTLDAIVEWKKVRMATAQGVVYVTKPVLTLIDLAQIAARTGGLGVRVRDEFTLPNGDTNLVTSLGGFMDAGTAQPIPTEITLG